MDNYRKDVLSWQEDVRKAGSFIVFDTETTGLKPTEADVIEFSAIRYDADFNEQDRIDVYINNGYPLPEIITELTGITDAEIEEKGVSPEDAAKLASDFLGSSPVLAGYNSVSFDTPFCKKLFNRCGADFTFVSQLDVLKMAREKCPKPHKLSDMVAYFGIPEVAFHRSIEDVVATCDVLRELLPLYEKEEPKASITGFVVKGVKRWTKSESLDRLYVSNNLNKSVYYDISNNIWVTDDLSEEDVIEKVLEFTGKASVNDLIA